MNLLDRERAIAATDGFHDGATRPGHTVTLSGEQVMNSLSSNARIHMQLSCNNLSEDGRLRQALLFAQLLTAKDREECLLRGSQLGGEALSHADPIQCGGVGVQQENHRPWRGEIGQTGTGELDL